MKILYLEDDVEYATKLTDFLNSKNLNVIHVDNIHDFHDVYLEFKPQLILSDLYIKDLSIKVLLKIISTDYDVSKLIISNTTNKEDEVTALSYAIQDFISKDSTFEAIYLRILKVLERNDIYIYEITIFSKRCILNTLTREITNNDDILIRPTNTEFELLLYFLMNKNRLLTNRELLAVLPNKNNDEKYVSVIINRLRTKLKITNINSVRFKGYMWVE